MSKNIVFCADGTWNGPGKADTDDQNATASNVFKLFLKLAGTDEPATLRLAGEQERSLAAADGSVAQVAKYLHGVGDSANFLAKILGGVLGAGLITRIVRGYTFVSRSYAPGDRIYLVGFSRGAYTARALAGLISAKGLLDPAAFDLSDKERAYRLGSAVWYQYRRDGLAAAGYPLGHLQEIAFDLPGFLQRPPNAAALLPAPIEVVAVWDTVGSLGIPQFDNHLLPVDVFQFANTALSQNVKYGCQAISIDEQRTSFTPTLWDLDPRIAQVLFPGAHADVGGGYTTSNNESGLSDCALHWITSELAGLGARFVPSPIAETPDPAGTAHQPWLAPAWRALRHAPRTLLPGLALSQSALDRLKAGPVMPGGIPYAPKNMGAYLNGTAAAPGVTVVPI
jgi:hypothetical protein